MAELEGAECGGGLLHELGFSRFAVVICQPLSGGGLRLLRDEARQGFVIFLARHVLEAAGHVAFQVFQLDVVLQFGKRKFEPK